MRKRLLDFRPLEETIIVFSTSKVIMACYAVEIGRFIRLRMETSFTDPDSDYIALMESSRLCAMHEHCTTAFKRLFFSASFSISIELIIFMIPKGILVNMDCELFLR